MLLKIVFYPVFLSPAELEEKNLDKTAWNSFKLLKR